MLPPIDTRVLTQAEYRKHYDKGWRASEGGSCLDDSEGRYLSRNHVAQLSAEHHAWLDGWCDLACSREKYHLETCENHGLAEGECGQ